MTTCLTDGKNVWVDWMFLHRAGIHVDFSQFVQAGISIHPDGTMKNLNAGQLDLVLKWWDEVERRLP